MLHAIFSCKFHSTGVPFKMKINSTQGLEFILFSSVYQHSSFCILIYCLAIIKNIFLKTTNTRDTPNTNIHIFMHPFWGQKKSINILRIPNNNETI